MADPIQSFLDAHQQSDLEHIPDPPRSTCCCGNDACAYLKHTQTALDDLEKDVSTAARLGKALLMRHEAYITDSEKERKAMVAQIESLEADKQSLERENANVVEENRTLLDQLEALNNAIAESDTQVTSLQATLASSQREMQKLTYLASRTEKLEQQLADFEHEQATWHSSLEAKEQSERSAVRRWQTAERTLSKLQEQIEHIEQEAKEERERHAEVVGRMERRHAVEKQLGSAASRLKGAAAVKNGDTDSASNGVVSHFVKDILQDNANLQMGIVELREMLNNSNEEVENLRGQLSLHSPTEELEEAVEPTIARKSLGAEMNRANSQELHVHHHYHAPPTAPKPAPLRRPKKKRNSVFSSGQFTPSSGTSTPRSSFSYGTSSPAAAILQQTAASVPQPTPGGKRWSVQSSSTYYSMLASSGPSSPQSTTNRTSSVFERVFSDAGQDSSRPTTPDTEDPGSPLMAPVYSKRGSAGWARTHSAPVVQRHGISCSAARPSLDSIVSMEELPKLDSLPDRQEPIPEEGEDVEHGEWDEENPVEDEGSADITLPEEEEAEVPTQHQSFYSQPLRRAGSHESLLSVSGMDIHTLKNRPSQLIAPFSGRALTSQAVISDTTAHAARPVAMSRTSTSGRTLLSGMAAEQRQPPKPNLGKKVGGWVFGRWGATPAPTTTDVSPAASSAHTKAHGDVASKKSDAVPVEKQVEPKKPKESKEPKARSPGINQSGSIQGFFADVKPTPTAPVVQSLDQEALRSLLDG